MNKGLAQALADYDAACRLPNNIHEMQTWETRKEQSREAALVALQNVFSESELESLFYLTQDLFQKDADF